MSEIHRIGQGYDLHRLEAGRNLILAGVQIPSDKGLVGHSDADIVLHAVIDAMLGAAGLGDIGEQFPDNDPAFKDIDSAKLFEKALVKVRQKGFSPVNVDVTIIAQQPKLSPYKPAMKTRLAQLLSLDECFVSVKAKTNEGMDAVGQGLAMACHTVIGLSQT